MAPGYGCMLQSLGDVARTWARAAFLCDLCPIFPILELNPACNTELLRFTFGQEATLLKNATEYNSNIMRSKPC